MYTVAARESIFKQSKQYIICAHLVRIREVYNNTIGVVQSIGIDIAI